MSVDTELRAIAVKSAARYPDSLLAAQGWTRDELVTAILQRLRRKYRDARADGALVIDPAGVVRPADACPTPLKRRFRNDRAARRYHRRHPPPGAPLWPYECPTGGHWHLTSQPQPSEGPRTRPISQSAGGKRAGAATAHMSRSPASTEITSTRSAATDCAASTVDDCSTDLCP